MDKFGECRDKGHEWSIYAVSVGYGSNEIEKAGKCMRCGYDTHEEVKEEE